LLFSRFVSDRISEFQYLLLSLADFFESLFFRSSTDIVAYDFSVILSIILLLLILARMKSHCGTGHIQEHLIGNFLLHTYQSPVSCTMGWDNIFGIQFL
jgi:uncharacterized protein YggT (Ycf19 family)